MIKIDPPHITGGSLYEQFQQLVRYLQKLAEQLNVELNTELENLQKTKEE
jgi:hypothetical protein